MISYRETAKNDLLKSLFVARRVIRDLNLGPATAQWFASWAGNSPFREIQAARDDIELAEIMKKTGARAAFQPFQDIFAYMGMAALSDDGEDADEESPRLYAALSAWGAFQNVPAQNPVLDDIAREVDAWLVLQGFWHLDAADRQPGRTRSYTTDEAERFLEGYLIRAREDRNPVANWLETMFSVLSLVHKSGGGGRENDEIIKGMIREAPQNERYYLKEILCNVSGLAKFRRSIMDVYQPIQLYGLELIDAPQNPLALADRLADLRRSFSQAIEPYILTDEASVKRSDFYESRTEGRPIIYFHATYRAAQKMADEFRSDRLLSFDVTGPPVVIPPRPPLRPRNLPPAPGM